MDSPSTLPNMPGFGDNRHDQSVYSVLIKTMLGGRVMIRPNEVDPLWPDYVGNGFYSKTVSENGNAKEVQAPFPMKAMRYGLSFHVRKFCFSTLHSISFKIISVNLTSTHRFLWAVRFSAHAWDQGKLFIIRRIFSPVTQFKDGHNIRGALQVPAFPWR
jgi:hypothetical protein